MSSITRTASVIALETLNLAIVAEALASIGLPAETDLPTAPIAYVVAYHATMAARRSEVFTAIETAGRDCTARERLFVEGMACAYARATAPKVANNGEGYQRTDTAPRAASPILARLAEAEAALADIEAGSAGPDVNGNDRFASGANWNRAFDARESLKAMAVKADPVAYVRAYPSHAFAYRHLLPVEMVELIEAAETDAAMMAAVATPTEAERIAIAEPAGRANGWFVTEAEDGLWYVADHHGDPDAEGEFQSEADAGAYTAATPMEDVAPVMVPQPVQQQQARARATRPARGERRNVMVRASDTGETFRVLTSVAGAGFAMIEDVPSNEHRAGELGGRLITHGAIRKAVVFASVEEGAAYAEQSRRHGWGHRYSPAAIVADPAPDMVPQVVQQAQGRDMRRGMARCEAPGLWQIGIYSVERDTAGCWVATATGPGTWGDGSPRRFGSLALAYHGVTGEPMPGHDGAGMRMVRQPVQQQQGKAPTLATPEHHAAIDYENRLNSEADPVERTYSSDTDMVACIKAAFHSGWQFDVASADAGEWAWFRPVETDADGQPEDSRAVQWGRPLGWRLYVETAAEALAEDWHGNGAPVDDAGQPATDPEPAGEGALSDPWTAAAWLRRQGFTPSPVWAAMWDHPDGRRVAIVARKDGKGCRVHDFGAAPVVHLVQPSK